MKPLTTVEVLDRLIGYPTVSRDSNLALIHWVRNYLDDWGVQSHLVPDATGAKANLFATIGPQRREGLAFSGHTDVVPVDDQNWQSDPFVMRAHDGKFYGRGTCDMKGFIAAAVAFVPQLTRMPLRRPVHLMLSYDEEVGCIGAPFMIAAMSEQNVRPGVVIVGEPTGMQVANAHKGICTSRTRVTGTPAHSSQTHLGVSAVMIAGELIARLGALERGLRSQRFSGAGLEPPYTTLAVNRIEGGTALNILASSCEFAWEVRALPGDDPAKHVAAFEAMCEAVVAELRSEGRECSVATQTLADVPALDGVGGAAEALARSVLQVSDVSIAVPFATEAGQFQQAGWPSVVCGPGSITQAHRPDEFVAAADLERCEQFLQKAVQARCIDQSRA